MKLWIREMIFWWGLSIGILLVVALSVIGAWVVLWAAWRLW